MHICTLHTHTHTAVFYVVGTAGCAGTAHSLCKRARITIGRVPATEWTNARACDMIVREMYTLVANNARAQHSLHPSGIP